MKKVVDGTFQSVSERDIILGITFKEYTIDTNKIVATSIIEMIDYSGKPIFKRSILFDCGVWMTITSQTSSDLVIDDWDL